MSSNEIIQSARTDLEKELVSLEKGLNGMACGFSGDCPYCGTQPCARVEGKPCRHPEIARPSLEALGFDVTALSMQCLDTPVLWGKDGKHPDYYMLVGAVFFNK